MMSGQTNKIVLLVDDDETVLKIQRRMLEALGFDVLTATDGCEGVETYKEIWKEIDFIVLDLNMPNMDGEEAFMELRKINDKVPIILSSACSEEEVAERFNGKKLSGYIRKPYYFKELDNKIKDILG
jgi:DNA-binding response OmpR family regulator